MKALKTTLKASIGLLGLAALLAVPAVADQVILDDLIVDGSLCVGFDCVNGESFGFDTIRLKENNLRIKAHDTSVVPSFPDNHWQITFNDSANGGANKFSIDDISGNRTPFTIEAGARSHSLYVDDGGRIGIRTSTPSVEIHVIDGDTPTLRLQQDGSSGFAPQTWDVAGNETNFFIRDVTNGSQLPLRIRPDAPTNSIFIDVDGSIGLGTSSPSAPLHIRRTATGNEEMLYIEQTAAESTRFVVENTNATAQVTGTRLANTAATWQFELSGNGNFQITESGSGGPQFLIDENATGNQAKYTFADGATDLMEIEADGDVNSATGAFGTLSDRNAKRDIQPVDPADVLAKVAAMPISTWRYKTNSDELHLGPMGQDFWAAFGLHQGPRSIALNDLAGVALAAVQGLNLQIEVLDAQLESKDQVIRELLERVSALEARLAE